MAETLAEMLRQLSEGDQAITSFVAWIQSQYSTTRKSAVSFLYSSLRVLGFIECDGQRVGLTEQGRDYLRTRDPGIIVKSAIEKITAVDDLLRALEGGPKTRADLASSMRAAGHVWSPKSKQILNRLRWLRAGGAVERRSEAESLGRYPEWVLVA